MTDQAIYDFLDDVFINYFNSNISWVDALNEIANKMKEIREGEKK